MVYSDILDLSAARAQEEIDRAVLEISKKVKHDISGTGTCECCKATVEPTWIYNHTKQVVGRWCSVECRDRHEV
jgi:hypothetical protein